MGKDRTNVKELKRKWRIDVLHHSHTDIGYTDRQELVCRQHGDFLRQAVNILRLIDAGQAPEQQGFCWQCENFWQVERFLQYAGEEDRQALAHYIREKRIGLSASYLNLTDLIDERVLREHLALARAFADEIGAPMESAMTADVNGYSAGLPDALAEAGVKYLYSAVHTHHGMFPLYNNPAFFRWRGPGGKSVLAFSGEHYHWGHALGLCPNGISSYMMDDDIRQDIERGKILSSDARTTEQEELDLAEKRITRYLAALEEHGWPLDFVPVFVSGVISDNAPPNGRVAERVNRLNERFAGRVTLGMTTLDDFFKKLESAGIDMPEYAGDWTDWWADGIGSTPEAVKMYREAQRCRNLAALMDPRGQWTDPALWRQSGRDMMLFAEHTWGHSASVSDPYSTLVSALQLKKTAFAVCANNAAGALLDGVKEGLGSRAVRPDRPGRIRIMNPYPFPVTAPAAASLLWWEMLEGKAQDETPLILMDPLTNQPLPTQTGRGPRGRLAETVLTLAPGETRELRFACARPNQAVPPHTASTGADGVSDTAGYSMTTLPDMIETDSWIIRTDADRGVASIVEKNTGFELLSPGGSHGAFTCLYFVTPTVGPRNAFRRQMGRRRQTVNTRKYTARPLRFSIAEKGDISVTLNVAYQLEGVDECALDLKIYRHIPRLDARVRIKKNGRADPEEIQVALPFVTDGSNETWIDKTGCAIRPGLDQLPGTCQAFWCLQNGVVRRGNTFDLLICCPDAPLVSFGEEQNGPVQLCDGQSAQINRGEIRSRIMNNFWETNFSIDLGGWHEFHYTVTLEKPGDPAAQLKRCEALSMGLPVLEL